MNRFVLLVDEDYDCYTVTVAHTVETELSREELLADMRAYGEGVVAAWNTRPTTECPHPQIPKGSYTIPGSVNGHITPEAFILSGVGAYSYSLVMPRLLTVDEWFAEGRR